MKEKFFGHPKFYERLKTMAEIHSKKNRDYASEEDPLLNFKMCKQMGVSPFMGCLIRISDKYSRICSFARKGFMEVKDESVLDTLIDLANYSIIASILYEEKK